MDPKRGRQMRPRPDDHRVVNLGKPSSSGKKTVKLTVSYDKQPKPFLGGYKDLQNDKVYLNAQTSTQTEKTKKENVKDQASQTCQTFKGFNDNNTVAVQTPMHRGQQMDRPDYFMSTQNDYVLYSRPYLPASYYEEKRLQAAISIQKHWRQWLAIKQRTKHLDGLVRRVQWAENVRRGRTDQRLMIHDDEINRQSNPNSLLDIELLYRAINIWRKDEEEYVKKNRWGAERRAALATLTDTEADLLLEIDKVKSRIKGTQKDKYIDNMFIKMGRPLRWLGSKTEVFISMDNDDKKHARRLYCLYLSLKEPVESKDERFQILENLYDHIKCYNDRASEYLVQLIGREISMINRKSSQILLSGVRQRLCSGFYRLCLDPKFNPEAKSLLKVPWDTNKLRKDMVQCKGCRRMQPRDAFTIVRGTTLTTRCKACMELYRTTILRADLNLYRHMLKELRRDELKSGVTNSSAFLVDAFDLQFLVERIWHGQSALSGIDNRYLLRLSRWDRDLPWTPWNCVLLTEEEAVAHLQITNINNAYQDTFLHKVQITQCAARTYFERLTKLSLNLDAKLEQTCYEVKTKETKYAKKRSKKAREQAMAP